MSWNWFHRLASPRWFYQLSGRWQPALLACSLLLLIIGLGWGLLFAPADYQQGNSYRIIFAHVPAAFLAQAIYLAIALAGAVSLIWKLKLADMLAETAAPVGASFTFLALVTGAIWGKPTWGTWWIWDARLTSMLILLFLYFGLIALRGAIQSQTVAAKATALLALVGAVNIPIIKYSVEFWNTLHQPATLKLTEKPAMALEMLLPLLLCIVAFYLFATWAVVARLRNTIIWRERRSQWVTQLLGEEK